METPTQTDPPVASTDLFGWISIAERMPEMGELVLFVCDINGEWTEPETGRWTGKKTKGVAIVMDYGDDPDWYPCSHWMPLPSLPRFYG